MGSMNSPIGKFVATYKGLTSQMVEVPKNGPYHTLADILDGTKEAAHDQLTLTALAGMINFHHLKRPGHFVVTRTTTLKEIGEKIHIRPERVKESLQRLQDQFRIFIVNDAKRGIGGRLIVQISRGPYGRLGIPTLSPEKMFNQTGYNIYRAAETGGSDKQNQYLKWLVTHLKRMTDPHKDEFIENWKQVIKGQKLISEFTEPPKARLHLSE